MPAEVPLGPHSRVLEVLVVGQKRTAEGPFGAAVPVGEGVAHQGHHETSVWMPTEGVHSDLVGLVYEAVDSSLLAQGVHLPIHLVLPSLGAVLHEQTKQDLLLQEPGAHRDHALVDHQTDLVLGEAVVEANLEEAVGERVHGLQVVHTEVAHGHVEGPADRVDELDPVGTARMSDLEEVRKGLEVDHVANQVQVFAVLDQEGGLSGGLCLHFLAWAGVEAPDEHHGLLESRGPKEVLEKHSEKVLLWGQPLGGHGEQECGDRQQWVHHSIHCCPVFWEVEVGEYPH